MKPVHLAIVVYGLTENWLGGVNYYRNLIAVFDGAQAAGMTLHVLTNKPAFFDDMTLSPRVRIHRVAMLEHRSLPWLTRKLLLKFTGRDLMLSRFLQRLGVSAVVFSHVPGASEVGIRCTPWIPDFQSQHHPELFQPLVVRMERERAQHWLRTSDGIIVSSAAARDDAMALFGARPEQLHVMRFAPKLDNPQLCDPALRDQVFRQHQVDRAYFFLPNQYWQHKNHQVVVDALALLRDRGAPLPLVISTGKPEDPRHPGYFPAFQERLRALGLEAHYRVLGVIDRQHMLVLLAHSLAVINPSRFEGWSTSVEEAKALGKALLVSDIPVHCEQIQAPGLAADTFPADDAATLARLMQQKLENARGAQDHPPQPRPEIYRDFETQFMALLRQVAQQAGATG